MDPLLAAVAAAGLLIGATGTWSPCGFSMIETIGPTGHTGGLRTTLAASATFAPFALLGGSITFLLLALLGGLLGGSGPAGYAIAAGLAIAAAGAEAKGLRIVPQVRRQLPVAWRSRLPMPVAAAGYGVLLGLGFTTFVLTYGVWALMGIALLVADPLVGLVVGVAFGAGRALPIVLLAPFADRPAGERACEAMALRPGLYRGARLGDAAALMLVAAVLAGGAGAQAARKEIPRASDPSAAGPVIAYERSEGRGELRRADGSGERLAGSDPAIGGQWVALARRGRISILDRTTLSVVGSLPASGVDAIAVTGRWVAYRVRRRHRDGLRVTALDAEGSPGATRKLAKVKRPQQLSRPAIEGNRLVVAVARSGRNELVRYELRGDRRPRRRTLISTRAAALAGPSIAGKKIAYVRTTAKRQTLRIKGGGGGKGRALYRRRSGPPTLWTTAISGNRVLVTLVKQGGGSKIISVPR
jgi:hypothetical protein